MILATSTLGNVAQWVTLFIAGLIAWRITRGGGGTAVDELSKANEFLTKRVHELGAEVRDLRIENGELKQRTDFQTVLETHEARAQARAEKTLKVLELIADRLGPDEAT